jgi:NAD(P)-dependent dehydrogenase (short-subunit alcohol dehydrogenase family)
MPTLQSVFQCDHPVALVTGSGSPRVGRVIAHRLAELGCELALHANTSLAEAEREAGRIGRQFGRPVLVVAGSLADESVPERLVREAHQRFGRIDILVNSAAIWRPTKLRDITPHDLRDYFQVNAAATFFCARAAALRMAEQRSGGSIVNIGDWATVRPYLDHAAYFPSKGAVETMTRSLAVEFAQLNPNVRVNCIQPGPVLLAEDVPAVQAQRIAASTLVGRVGTPDHVAHAVQFLCENDFVTGVCLPVDGGRSVFAPDGLQVGINTG